MNDDAAVAALQALARILTVGDRDPAQVDTAMFDEALGVPAKHFPLLHEQLEPQVAVPLGGRAQRGRSS